MANTFKIKRSGTASAVPTTLEAGEIAINWADWKLFFGDGSTVNATMLISPSAWSNLQSAVAGKVDAADALLKAGGTMTGKFITRASTAEGGAALNIPYGGIPAQETRENGDIWHTANNIYVHLNGATRTFIHTGYWTLVSQAEAEAGTGTTVRTWTPERVRQAIEAVTGGYGTAVSLDIEDVVQPAQLNLAYREITDTTFTLAATDNRGIIELTNVAAATGTVPTNASVALPVGFRCCIVNSSAVDTPALSVTGLTIRPDNTRLKIKSKGSAFLAKIATDTWIFAGDLIS